ncbi:MAG: hypothetical protein SXA11_01205 [Cyanobacteriota bacterium]|nr:hypothetical protein [Cyanobacteriota bacterium]
MTDEKQNNQEKEQNSNVNQISNGEPSPSPGAEKETSSKPGTEKETSSKLGTEEENGSKNEVSRPLDTEEENGSKKEEKGLYADRYSSKAKYWNPFGKEEHEKSKDPNQFYTKEKSKYSDLPKQLLEKWIERNQTEIKTLEQQYGDLTEEIENLSEEKTESNSLTEQRRIQKKLDRCSREREETREKLEQFEKDLSELNEELRKRKSNKENNKGTDCNNWSEEVEKITAQSLFADDDPIKNTILYVATFFPGLNPQDFKRVVSLLLADRTKTIFIKESITTEEEKTQVKETKQEKQLTEIWQESFEQSDGYFHNCHLRVIRQNGVQGIYFTIPTLRDDFLTYFEQQQPLYLEEQLQKTQRLDLLLDVSDDVATKAIDVAVKASVDYPSSYAESWLIELFLKIDREDKRRINPLLVRLSNLIYRLQIEPDYSRAKDIAQSFLESLMLVENLMSPENRSRTFDIVQYLIDKHLRSGSLGIQPAKKLLTWLKKLLDQENWEKKNTDLQADIYSLLDRLLWQSGFYDYIYDFLGILSEWLPQPNAVLEKYSPSNKSALLLLFAYCNDTVFIWNSRLEWYGEWPSIYPLFAPLKNQDDSYTSNKFDAELDILFSWLFHSSSQKELALINVFKSLDLDDINPLEEIGRFIAEWLVILRGFDGAEPEKEVANLIEDMARSIISNTSRSLKSELSDFWTSLTEEYLEQAAKYNESGDRKSQKQFTARRKILRDFKKKFRALQKEMKAAK